MVEQTGDGAERNLGLVDTDERTYQVHPPTASPEQCDTNVRRRTDHGSVPRLLVEGSLVKLVAVRTCIDCAPLLITCAGMKTYLYHFARNLLRQAGEHEVSIYPFLDWPDRLGGIDLLDPPPLYHEGSMAGARATAYRLLYISLINKGRHSALNWLTPGADLFYATNHVRNPPTNKKLVTTVHDLSTWTVPNSHTASQKEFEETYIEQIVRPADAVIAITESTRNDLIRLFDFPPEKVEVIYPGFPDAFYHADPKTVAATRSKYGLDGPYLLHVGTIEPRKNIDRLLDAFERLKPSLQKEFPLVLIGMIGWADATTVERVKSPPKNVRYLGYVPEEDLPPLTAGATVCVSPSLYEGYGLPVPQAMAAGTPVLTSNVSSLPEIAGDAALLVDPKSTDEIIAGIERLLLSPSLREELVEKGHGQARRFDWAESAKQTWRFFERVVGGVS